MPYEWTCAKEFMEHNGVSIYHIYCNDKMSETRTCWYSLSEYGSDEDGHNENGTFDYRELPEIEDNDDITARIANAIETGYFEDWEVLAG